MTVMPLALALRQDLTESSKKMHSCGVTPSSSVALAKIAGSLLSMPSSCAKNDALEAAVQVVDGERRFAVRGDAAREDRHTLALCAELFQILAHMWLERDVGVVVLRQLHPLRHDLIRAFGEMAVFLGEHGGEKKDSVRHTLIILLGIGVAAAGEKVRSTSAQMPLESMSVPSRSKRYMERLLLKNIFMGYLPNAALFATIGDILVSLRIIPSLKGAGKCYEKEKIQSK